MTPERLDELRDKVRHGYNLLASEAREVFENYGEPIDPQRARCQACGGEGDRWYARPSWGPDSRERLACDACRGTGYVPVVGEVVK